MTTTTTTVEVTVAGVYDGMSDDVYHGDPVPGGSLSSTGARRLLPPSCPAKYRHERDNPPASKREFDLGKAAHLQVLGTGPDIEVVPGDRWDTKAAKEHVAAVRARGATPLKQADYDRVQAMAAALRAHPWAGKLFAPRTGRAEQSLFWVDSETGVWCRARLDWLRRPFPGRRLLVPDYKSCASADPDKLQRAIHDHGYYIQAAFYLAGMRALGLADADTQFLFVCQEKEPPHVVTVAQPDPVAMRIGAQRAREALRIYAECTASGRWPGYCDDVATIPLPPWAENRYLEESW